MYKIDMRSTILIILIISLAYFVNLSIEVKSEPYIQTIHVNADTFISQHNKTTNFHGVEYLVAGKDLYGHLRHALINFSVLGIRGLPKNIEILKAELYITRYKLEDFLYQGYVEIGVCRVTSFWDYVTVNWRYRTYTQKWGKEGGDFSKPYARYKVYSYYKPKKTMVFDITQMVKEWYNDPKKYPNYGLAITYISGRGLIYFYSANMRGIKAEEKPHIKVTYIYKIKITPPSSTIIIGTGNTKTIDIQVSGYCPFTVNLELKDCPSGITYNFSPPSGYTTFISKLSITVSSKMSTGTYTVKIHAYGEGVECEKELILKIVPGGRFTLTLNPSHITVSQGGNGSSTIRASISGIFSSPITLSIESVPQGFTATINPKTISPYDSSVITINVNSTVSPGTYDVVIRGTGGGKTCTAVLKVEVKPIPFNFNIQVSPQEVNVKSGEPVYINISTILLAGVSEQLSLSLSGLPPDTNYRFNPSSIRPPGLVTLTIDTSNLDGTYNITITASNGGVTRKAKVLLKVSGFDFTISVNPKSIEIAQGESKTITVIVKKIRGIAKPVALSLLNLPADASYSFNPPILTPPGTSILTINAGSAKGTHVLIIRGSGGGIIKTTTLTVIFKERKCIIATATYGSEVSNEVNILRRFRDGIVLSTYAGRQFYMAFNTFYYSWSPYIAKIIYENQWLKIPMKILLYPLIILSLAVVNAVQPIMFLNKEVAVYIAGTMISYMLGTMYITPIQLLDRRFLRKRFYILLILTLSSLILCILSQIFMIDSLLSLSTFVYTVFIMLLASLIIPCLLKRLEND